jgi:hypothetical protein
MSHNLTDHFELYFPDENYFSSQNLPMERALSKQLTILILYFIMLFHAKKNEFWSTVLDQDNNVIAAVVTQETLANTNN